MAGDEYPLVLIHGPPGTGETSTLVVYILTRLTRIVDERPMVYSPQYVVVQVLVQSTAAPMEEDNINYQHCEIASPCPHPSLGKGISNPDLLRHAQSVIGHVPRRTLQ